MLIVNRRVSLSEAEQPAIPVAVNVKVTDPELMSFVPGTYSGLSVSPAIKLPSPDVVQLNAL